MRHPLLRPHGGAGSVQGRAGTPGIRQAPRGPSRHANLFYHKALRRLHGSHQTESCPCRKTKKVAREWRRRVPGERPAARPNSPRPLPAPATTPGGSLTTRWGQIRRRPRSVLNAYLQARSRPNGRGSSSCRRNEDQPPRTPRNASGPPSRVPALPAPRGASLATGRR
jgi:hypothetical protein